MIPDIVLNQLTTYLKRKVQTTVNKESTLRKLLTI
jgi:hypothetical protein